MKSLLLPVFLCSILASHAAASDPLLADASTPGRFALAQPGAAASLWVAGNDWPGVLRAARDVQSDIERVTGSKPSLSVGQPASAKNIVLIGTLGKSELIDGLVRSGKLNADAIRGRWEAFQIEVIDQPLHGIDRALVITGSDKRGTAYGIYELSQQIGVSPWFWWADVPVPHRDELFIRPDRHVNGGPVVKYRGIFLNDEAPALSGWTKEKFGGFNHLFYEKVFELLLRLRANYLWPAMWGSAFNDDDPLNAKLADEYGIVMGTSHHEPLMRAHDEWRRYGRGPWDYAKNPDVLREFWRSSVERTKTFENIQSLGMRGDGDEPMSEQANVALLERIVADQRKILADVTGRTATEVPQLWALYKEVQGYYERGMRVPDDVTLLWCDDNWGNIRRLPTAAERKRSGGAGIYYHFDYVGGPRNYKWLNTIQLTKIQEQMNLAWQYDANRIWIVNVGDLKPMEFPIEFFLTMAWDPARWPADKLTKYSEQWATRQFGAAHASEVAALINAYTKLNGRRKPEMLAPDTYSLVNYRESERVLVEWRDLVTRSENLNRTLAPEYHDAFFQLVLYPVKASANAQELYVAAGLNRLYTRQGRTAANTQAARVRELFAEDGRLVTAYHSLGGGKWNHLMDQVKFGYTYWQQPDIETMPAVSEVRARSGSAMGIAIEGSETAWPSYGAGRALLPPLDALTANRRWIEIFNRGATSFTYQATADQSWITLSPASGNVTEMTRLEVAANWEAVPPGDTVATILITGSTGERLSVQVPVRKNPPAVYWSRSDPAAVDERTTARAPIAGLGFVESDGHLAIEAPHFSRAINQGEIEWKTLPDFGRTLGGVTAFPVTASSRNPDKNGARLEYDVDVSSPGAVNVELYCAPSLDFQPGEELRIGLSFDDQPVTILKLDTAQTPQTWEKAVGDGARRINSKQTLDRPGSHVLKIWFVTPGVVLEKIVLDFGGVRPSYLGPPESNRGPDTPRLSPAP